MISIKSFFNSINNDLLEQVKEYAKYQGFTLDKLLKKSRIKSMPISGDSIGYMEDVFELVDLLIMNI